MRTKILVTLAAATVIGCAPANDRDDVRMTSPALVGELLPDLIVRESDLYDNTIDYSNSAEVQFRLSNGTANVGEGKLHLYGVPTPNEDGTQDVMQRIFNSSGQFEDRLAGEFLYHPSHNHIHFEGWAAYRLRSLVGDDGVGDIVAEGEKTSFCIIDLGIYSSDLPNFDPDGEFHSCSSLIQGLAVGWIDVYSKFLDGQSIDITGVPDGTYWLESEVDPDNLVRESDETNNVTRIKVTIGDSPLAADAFEPNGSTAAVDSRPEGGPNSPNLGPTGPTRTVSGLSIDSATDVDWFRFYANDVGAAGDLVRIDFNVADGDLDLYLHDAAGTQIAASEATGASSEEISLEGYTEGWYYARVVAKAGATQPDYSLTVDPPSNQAPSVVVTAPPAGDTQRVHSVETFNIAFSASDPEADDTWVSIYVNDTPTLDGTEELLPTSLHTPGAQGFYIFNSADVEPGTYWVYAEVTDGGTVSGAWSDGTITFIPGAGTDCTTASDVSAVAFPFTLTGLFASGGTGGSCDAQADNAAWFSYTPATSGTYQISLSNASPTNAWSRTAVFEGDSCAPVGAEVACNSANAKDIDVSAELTAGTSYRIMFYTDGPSWTMVSPTISIEEAVVGVGDTCDAAVDVSAVSLPHQLTGDYDFDPGVAGSCDTTPTNAVWYQFTAPSTDLFEVRAENFSTLNSYSRLAVFEGGVCNPLGAELACDRANARTISSTVALTQGQTYTIAFYTDGDSWTMVDPSIDIAVAVPMAGDTCQQPELLDSATFPHQLSGTFDSDGLGGSCDPTSNNAVWYTYTPSVSGSYDIAGLNASTTNAWSRIAVFDTTSCSPLQNQVACETANAKSVTASSVGLIAGTEYLIVFYTDGESYTMVDPSITISQ